jgi:hypothetical protein
MLHAQEKIFAIIQPAIKCYGYALSDKGLGYVRLSSVKAQGDVSLEYAGATALNGRKS